LSKEEVFYRKVGRKYVPVSYYNNEVCDAFPKGTHLVQVYDGGSMRRYDVDPAYAPMIAAGRVAEDAISRVIMQAQEMRPKQTPLTEEQREAWNNLIRVFGDSARYLEWPSAREASQKAVAAMAEEAERLLANPTVRKAYERFLLIAELTKEHNVTAQTR
jgi:hypothetical protein